MNNQIKSRSVYNHIMAYRQSKAQLPDAQDIHEMRGADFPLVPAALIAELERRWPHLSPQPGEQVDSMYWRGGCREVVDFLRAAYDAQQGDVLSRPVIAEALAPVPKKE